MLNLNRIRRCKDPLDHYRFNPLVQGFDDALEPWGEDSGFNFLESTEIEVKKSKLNINTEKMHRYMRGNASQSLTKLKLKP